MRNSGVVVVRMHGGLGNQLFMYAAARQLALRNNVPLKLDVTSGFKRDNLYRRRYLLDHFNIRAAFATRSESMETPLGRAKRHLWRRFGKYVPANRRLVIIDRDRKRRDEILTLVVDRPIYLEGIWADEIYFKDISPIIRDEFRVTSPHSPETLRLAQMISNETAVCVHARLLPGANTLDAVPDPARLNLSADYYARAMAQMGRTLERPHFFCFSDYPDWLRSNLKPDYPVTFVAHNRGDDKSYEDFWLMTQCKHFVIANSSFSWWAAWLATNSEKQVITPDMKKWLLPEFPGAVVLPS